jgi:HlyD family secretion protein
MSSKSSPLVPLALAAVVAVGAAVGIHHLGQANKVTDKSGDATTSRQRWAAAAPGRIEPKGGEIKLSALSAGQIQEVIVSVNDKVAAGDLLAMIDAQDIEARIAAAEAEVGVRRRERDTETNLAKLAQDRRNAEDALAAAERALTSARRSLDRLFIARQASATSVTAGQIEAARSEVVNSASLVETERENLRQARLVSGAPLPTRLETGLTAARAELTAAEAALERTRVRAPADGTVLQTFARIGETAAATPEQPLFVIGDLSALRVRAEVEERDVSKVAVGQPVVLKTDAFPDQEFKGRVVVVASAMRPPRLAQRGPRRPNDIDSLEVEVDVDAGTPLMPGMRVDVLFRSETAPGAAAPTQPAAQQATVTPSAASAPVAAPAQPGPAAAATSPQVLPPLATGGARTN